jgi:hypothetical protein
MVTRSYSDTHDKESGINGPPTFSERLPKVCLNSSILYNNTVAVSVKFLRKTSNRKALTQSCFWLIMPSLYI